jgi:hypothetical protein
VARFSLSPAWPAQPASATLVLRNERNPDRTNRSPSVDRLRQAGGLPHPEKVGGTGATYRQVSPTGCRCEGFSSACGVSR